jgi:hypothetical protein
MNGMKKARGSWGRGAALAAGVLSCGADYGGLGRAAVSEGCEDFREETRREKGEGPAVRVPDPAGAAVVEREDASWGKVIPCAPGPQGNNPGNQKEHFVSADERVTAA